MSIHMGTDQNNRTLQSVVTGEMAAFHFRSDYGEPDEYTQQVYS
jgi:hypothetical protein